MKLVTQEIHTSVNTKIHLGVSMYELDITLLKGIIGSVGDNGIYSQIHNDIWQHLFREIQIKRRSKWY